MDLIITSIRQASRRSWFDTQSSNLPPGIFSNPTIRSPRSKTYSISPFRSTMSSSIPKRIGIDEEGEDSGSDDRLGNKRIYLLLATESEGPFSTMRMRDGTRTLQMLQECFAFEIHASVFVGFCFFEKRTGCRCRASGPCRRSGKYNPAFVSLPR